MAWDQESREVRLKSPGMILLVSTTSGFHIRKLSNPGGRKRQCVQSSYMT